MSKKIRIGTSPLTGTIFAGHLLKCGRIWAANKQDVTTEAVCSVIEYLQFKERKGIDVAVEDGEFRYELKLSTTKLDKPKEAADG